MTQARLRSQPLQIVGRMPEASNLTLLARTADGLACIYKPSRGERDLWDFPAGTLAAREAAMFELAEAFGWPLVPPTVLRDDGPLGPGMCQLFVEAGEPVVAVLPDGRVPPGWVVAAAGEGEVLAHGDGMELRRLALLDVVAGNADRKGGHVLRDSAGRLWGIDHGLTFHEHDKLRTVLWGFAGDAIDEADLEVLRTAWDGAAARLGALLPGAEVDAAGARLDRLVRAGRFPMPEPGWPRLPWPLI